MKHRTVQNRSPQDRVKRVARAMLTSNGARLEIITPIRAEPTTAVLLHYVTPVRDVGTHFSVTRLTSIAPCFDVSKSFTAFPCHHLKDICK